MDPAELAALLAALGIGGLVGTWFRAEHERLERFRERMISVTEEFLTSVDSARTEFVTAMTAISRGDMEAGKKHYTAGQLKVEAAMAASSRMSVVFPPAGPERQHVVSLAFEVIRAVRRLAQVVDSFGRGELKEPRSLEAARVAGEGIGLAQGRFASAASSQVWRRWFLGVRPRHALRARLARGRRDPRSSAD